MDGMVLDSSVQCACASLQPQAEVRRPSDLYLFGHRLQLPELFIPTVARLLHHSPKDTTTTQLVSQLARCAFALCPLPAAFLSTIHHTTHLAATEVLSPSPSPLVMERGRKRQGDRYKERDRDGERQSSRATFASFVGLAPSLPLTSDQLGPSLRSLIFFHPPPFLLVASICDNISAIINKCAFAIILIAKLAQNEYFFRFFRFKYSFVGPERQCHPDYISIFMRSKQRAKGFSCWTLKIANISVLNEAIYSG